MIMSMLGVILSLLLLIVMVIAMELVLMRVTLRVCRCRRSTDDTRSTTGAQEI